MTTGAKIGVGVAIPLVVILFTLGIFFYIRRRRQNHTVNEKPHNGPPYEADGAPIHELNNTFGAAPQLGGNPRHELHGDTSKNKILIVNEGPVTSEPNFAENKQKANSREASFPAPWGNQEPSYEQLVLTSSENPPFKVSQRSEETPEVNTGKEDAELAQLEREMAQVKERRERLEELGALQAREEQLRRTIEQKRKDVAIKP